jgi:hypothetical protein
MNFEQRIQHNSKIRICRSYLTSYQNFTDSVSCKIKNLSIFIDNKDQDDSSIRDDESLTVDLGMSMTSGVNSQSQFKPLNNKFKTQIIDFTKKRTKRPSIKVNLLFIFSWI